MSFTEVEPIYIRIDNYFQLSDNILVLELTQFFLVKKCLICKMLQVRDIKSGELTSVIQDPKENISLNPSSKTKMEVVDEVLSSEGDQASDNEKCILKVDTSES